MLDLRDGSETCKPASLRLAEAIADKIQTGVYAGRIPSVRALAAEHGVNFKTASRAVAMLVKRQVLESSPRRGTHVTAAGKELVAKLRGQREAIRLVLFFAPSEGELFAELHHRTTALLNRSGYFPVVVNDGDQEAILDQVLELRPAALVVNRGWNQFPHERVPEIAARGVRVIFQLKAECAQDLPADYVLSDPLLGAYEATRHLLSLGRRRILHLDCQLLPPPPPMIYRHCVHCQTLQGYRMALEEAGLAGQELPLAETGDESERLHRFMEAMDAWRPTALFAAGDFRALSKFGLLRERGVAVPGDLAVVGYFDTPSCQYSVPGLSSVSLGLEELAAKTAECVAATGGPRRIVVKPRLVVRESSAPPERRGAGR